MLERFFGNFGEKKEVFDGPNIRFHHLSEWSDFVNYYHKRFPKDIWKCSSKDLEKAKLGIKRKSEKSVKGLVEAQAWFKQGNFPLEKELYRQKELRYLKDTIGTKEETHKRVAKMQSSSHLEIIDLIAKNKDTKILISNEKDGICNSCAIGNHCTNNIFTGSYFDRDDVYQIVVSDMLKYGFWKKRGNFEIVDNQHIILSGELLFDKKFLPVVERNALIRFPKMFKDRDIVYEKVT